MEKSVDACVYRESLRIKILRAAMNAFTSQGVRNVKMDDIAHKLGISKRTLYEIYGNKTELLLESIKLREEQNIAYMREFSLDKKHSEMDILMEYYRRQIESLSSLNPLFISEIRRYPNVKAHLDQMKQERDERTQTFFVRGVEQGFFRADVDYRIVSHIAMSAVQHIIDTKMYLEYDLPYIFRNVFFVLIRGFCTPKGLNALNLLDASHRA